MFEITTDNSATSVSPLTIIVFVLILVSVIGFIVHKATKISKKTIIKASGITVAVLICGIFAFNHFAPNNTWGLTKETISEIGFNNIDEWGGKLIEIQPDDNDNYVFEDNFGKYVIIQEGRGIWEFYTEQNNVVMSSYYRYGAYTTEFAGTYTVLDNNTFSSGGYARRILNRFTYNGVNVVDMTDGGSLSDIYIPYSILDIDTMELYQENDRFDYYKCYLK